MKGKVKFILVGCQSDRRKKLPEGEAEGDDVPLLPERNTEASKEKEEETRGCEARMPQVEPNIKKPKETQETTTKEEKLKEETVEAENEDEIRPLTRPFIPQLSLSGGSKKSSRAAPEDSNGERETEETSNKNVETEDVGSPNSPASLDGSGSKKRLQMPTPRFYNGSRKELKVSTPVVPWQELDVENESSVAPVAGSVDVDGMPLTLLSH